MLVIGNGESRKTINLELLEGPKIGCNAIFRDYKVDHCICVDRRMVDEAIFDKQNNHTLIYTRDDWHNRYIKHNNILKLPELPYQGNERWDQPFQWGSGPYAALLGAMLADKLVKMIGFDLYGVEGKTNNIYKDTKNYNSSDKRAVDPRYWVHQHAMVFECFPKIKFIVYNKTDWDLPKAWIKPNVMVDNISNIYYNT